MPKKLYKNKHYNTPGHAHELTFSCYRRKPLFDDREACQLFLDGLDRSKDIYSFKLWAYVIMPQHVHLLLWPLQSEYDIGKMMSGIKGIMAKRYRKYLLKANRVLHDSLLLKINKQEKFIFWQKGGGFDRNLWNAKAIHDSIRYIEANPVRSRFVSSPEEWEWSSAYARAHKKGILPDSVALPVILVNPQSQRVGVV
jgi:putative transposase